MRNIKTSFSRITPESAEEGDFSETGWIDEDGENFIDDDLEDYTAINQAIRFLQNNGACFASSGCFHCGIWYMTESEIIDYGTGEQEERAFHLYGFSAEEEEIIYNATIGKKVR